MAYKPFRIKTALAAKVAKAAKVEAADSEIRQFSNFRQPVGLLQHPDFKEANMNPTCIMCGQKPSNNMNGWQGAERRGKYGYICPGPDCYRSWLNEANDNRKPR